MTEQGRPPRQPGYPGRPGRPRSGREPSRTGWQTLDPFGERAENDSDLPPWAVPGGIAPNWARRPVRRPPEHPGDERVGPGDRTFGDPRAARPGAAPPRTAVPRPRPAPPRRAPDLAGPYGDPLQYDEPAGYRRPPGYDEPGDYQPRRGRRPAAAQDSGYDEYGEDDHDGDQPAGRRLRRPGRTRAAAARRRRSKRRLLTWGSVAILIVVLVGGGLYLTRGHPKGSLYVRTLLKGEFRSVPSACKVLSAGALRQAMAGTPMVQPVTGVQGQSECTYTVDVKPAFRILQIQEQAYQPSLAVATGDGSATANAVWNFGWTKDQLAKPPKHAAWSAAKFSPVSRLGGQAVSRLGGQAVSAFQASVGKVATDRVTVLVRYRNVLIQVWAQAQEGGGFGPVPVADLRSAALTAARAAFAAVQHQPTA